MVDYEYIKLAHLKIVNHLNKLSSLLLSDTVEFYQLIRDYENKLQMSEN